MLVSKLVNVLMESKSDLPDNIQSTCKIFADDTNQRGY